LNKQKEDPDKKDEEVTAPVFAIGGDSDYSDEG
jgi:hypothetical protein